MSTPARAASTDWTPLGFDRYRELSPRTPQLAPGLGRPWTERFAQEWHAGETSAARIHLCARASRTTIVFVRGYLGHYMPGNLAAACVAMRRLGFDTFIGRNHAGGTVEGNVAALAKHFAARGTRERIVFCGHSRGGVECLTLLARFPALAERCDGVALSQTPHGPSRVLESVLLGRHRESIGGRGRAAEIVQRGGIALLRARPGGYELTSEVWPMLVAPVETVAWPFRVLQTASWSSHPTAWLDSFHRRLGQIGPGRAHDGQFFLEDLIWPALPHVLLPDMDHAQPALGGRGFDPARYWVAILTVLLGDPSDAP